MDLQVIKQRFGIIGNNHTLNRTIEVALQVAPTDLSVLITGESGSGKESIPQIIHQNSSRKHNKYIAVNCGAIPEGTIDSELFGHEKGSFTGALNDRKGYFEEADGGTIFLDEIGELPLSTQARLLRVLEAGEYIRVGSSKVQKTDIRIVAATNINFTNAIQDGKFREDLFYRLNTVPIRLSPLRERTDDIFLLFRKFASDFAEKYQMPSIRLTPEARYLLENYHWPGNIRQLKNVTEQISIIEQEKTITDEIVRRYLPEGGKPNLPTLYKNEDSKNFSTEREILYQVLFDMKKDMTDLKKLVFDLMKDSNSSPNVSNENQQIIHDLYHNDSYASVVSHTPAGNNSPSASFNNSPSIELDDDIEYYHEEHASNEIDIMRLAEYEKIAIQKALEMFNGNRRKAAEKLGISARTLYRKLKEYDLLDGSVDE
ncbi:MAG: sigma-54 interaction domain-containing protein [Mangrovibacterium sp.]